MIPEWMTRHLAHVQGNYIARLISEPDFALTESRSIVHNKLHDVFPMERAGKVLELGCGPGKYLPMLAALGHTVVGVDPCEFPTWRAIEGHGLAKTQSGVMAESLPFADGEFDHIACLSALLYFDDPALSLREMYRVLKPGGKVLLRTVNSDNSYTKRTGKKLDPTSRNLYTMEELETLILSANFVMDEKWSFGYWPPMFTNLWWYCICVLVSHSLQKTLSDLTDPNSRVVNVVVAHKPPSE